MTISIQEQLALAKQKAPADKESFDIQRFGQYYDLNDDRGELRITPEVIEDFEIQYYLLFPELKTLQELAEKRHWLEANGG